MKIRNEQFRKAEISRFMVGVRRAFLSFTAAGFLSGCATNIDSVFASAKTVSSSSKETIQQPVRERLKAPGSKLKDRITALRSRDADVKTSFNGGSVETRSMPFEVDGKSNVLLNVHITVDKKYSNNTISFMIVDNDFAVHNAYSLETLKASTASHPVGTIDATYVAENHDGISVLVTGNPKFETKIASFMDKGYGEEKSSEHNYVSHATSQGIVIKDRSRLFDIIESSVILEDSTTNTFEYRQEVGLQPQLHEQRLEEVEPEEPVSIELK